MNTATTCAVSSSPPSLHCLGRNQIANLATESLLQDLRAYDRQTFDSLWQDVHPLLLRIRDISTQKTSKTIDEMIKTVLGNDFDITMLASAASRLRVDIGSPAPTPQLTMEPDSPSSNPPSTRESVDEPLNRTFLPGTDQAKLPYQGRFSDRVKIHQG